MVNKTNGSNKEPRRTPTASTAESSSQRR
jgi:hypothetical protein